MIMTAYIGNNEIRHVLYFNRNKNTIINDSLRATFDYVNNREELYIDNFVILCNPGILLDGAQYTSFNDIPDTQISSSKFIFKTGSSYVSNAYHPSKPIAKSCSYILTKISFDANIRYTYYKKWKYVFDEYNFDYKKESWWVDSQGVQSTISVEDEQHIDCNQLTCLIIKGPTKDNDIYNVIFTNNTNGRIIVPSDFKSYKNISKLYAGEELVHENT